MNAPSPRYTTFAEIKPTLEDNAASRMMDQVMADFRRIERGLALGAKDKEVEELTEQEKFAIAFLAGVRMEWRPSDDAAGPAIFVTEECGIYKADGKFHVMTAGEVRAKERPMGQTITIPLNISPS